jgi:hypothetical protein
VAVLLESNVSCIVRSGPFLFSIMTWEPLGVLISPALRAELLQRVPIFLPSNWKGQMQLCTAVFSFDIDGRAGTKCVPSPQSGLLLSMAHALGRGKLFPPGYNFTFVLHT